MLHHHQTFLALALLSSILSVALVINTYFLITPPPPYDAPVHLVGGFDAFGNPVKKTNRDGFMPAIPQMVDPTKRPPPTADPGSTETPAAVQADADWRSILMFVQEHPEKAPAFLADMKAKFFDADCGLKQPRIDFANLATSYQPIFSL
jgi:hypothetical protein